MKITSFNIQNLFNRQKDFINKPAGKCVNNWLEEMNSLVRKEQKGERDLSRMRELSFLLGFEKRDYSTYAVLKMRGGDLYVHKCGFPKESKASHFNGWNGWIELPFIPLDPIAVQNKARVIAESNADVLLLQEVEDRSAFSELNNELLPHFNCVPYDELFILQGNDDRGQEIAMATKNGFTIASVRSLMGERRGDTLLFSKNLLVYEIKTPLKNTVFLIGAHLEEQRGEKEKEDTRRFIQAERIARLYKELRKTGRENIIVAGTFNTVPYCHSIYPIIRETDLLEITKFESFNVDFDQGKDAGYYRLGAYRMGVNIKQKDYLLLSPALFKRLKGAGLNRKGVFPSKNPQWPIYNTIDSKEHAASEHPALWADLDI